MNWFTNTCFQLKAFNLGLITSLLLTFGCHKNAIDCSQLLRYLHEVHGAGSSLGNKVIIILNLEGCSPCVESHLKELMGLGKRENFLLIIVGNSPNNGYLTAINELEFDISWDSNKLIYKYATPFGKPLLVHLAKGSCLRYEEINDPDIEPVYNLIKKWTK